MKTFHLFLILLVTQAFASAQTSYDSLIIPPPAGFPSYMSGRVEFEAGPGNKLWIISPVKGAYAYDTLNHTGAHYHTGNSGLMNDSLRDIFIDSTGGIWIVSKQELVYFDGSSWQNKLSIPCYSIAWSNNKLLVSTKGAGIGIWDGIQWNYSNMSNSTLNSDTVLKIIALPSGKLFASTENKTFVCNSWNNGLPVWNLTNYSGYPIEDIAERSDGTLWMINQSRQLYLGVVNSFVNYRDLREGLQYNPLLSLPCPPSSGSFSRSSGVEIYNQSLIALADPVSLGPPPALDTLSYLFNDQFGFIDSAYLVPIRSPFSALLKVYNQKAYILDYNNNAHVMYCIDLAVNTPQSKDSTIASGKTLFINKVSTLINGSPGSIHYDPYGNGASYQVPRCSGTNLISSSGIWLGGYDPQGVLRLSASTYNQGNDFSFCQGPLDTITAMPAPGATHLTGPYAGAYSMLRSEIDEFKTAFAAGLVQNGTYIIPNRILDWPAQGTGNFTRNLAPWFDFNGDGVYNPINGDYPEIKGDQMIFAVFNDRNYLSQSPIGVEIHLSAYAYSCQNFSNPADTILNYTTFYHYKLINRSGDSITNFRFAFWSDPDIGFSNNDYAGCDVMRQTGYAYNADTFEYHIGYDIPAIGVTVLQGPLADAGDALDNNMNGIVDEPGETWNMSNFMVYNNVISTWTGNPFNLESYYNYMKSYWLNGQPLTFGGDGFQLGNPPAYYIYSDTTDPWFPFSGTGAHWTMANASVPPDDYRIVANVGSRTLEPFEESIYEFAVVYGAGDSAGGPYSAVQNLLNGVDIIRSMYDNNSFPICSQVGIAEYKSENQQLLIAPNPASSFVEILTVPKSTNAVITLYDINGKQILNTSFKRQLNINELPSGIYILMLQDGNVVYRTKLIKTLVD